MKKVVPLLLAAIIALPVIGLSQTLKGRVMNESGLRASGVTVRFQNKANAITTNADGTFKITATKLPDTLVFSSAGYEPYKVVITEKNIKDPDFEVVLLNKREDIYSELTKDAPVKAIATPVVSDEMKAKGYSGITGVVVDEYGNRIPGASVRIKGARTGVAADYAGQFGLVAKTGDVLQVTAPGIAPVEVKVEGKKSVTVSAKRNVTAGTEVVVTALGAKRKPKSLGFSTTTISGGELLGTSSTVYRASPGDVYHLSYDDDGKYDKKLAEEYKSYGTLPVDDGKYFFADTNIGPRTGVAAKSRILTAGEVNDFNKWKMWEEYTENEFKSMGNFWGIMPTKRYTAQLTDKKFNAVVNEPVFLVNKATHDTVWKAYTDNTGKAELWAGFIRDDKEGDNYYITSRTGNKLMTPAVFTNGVNTLSVDRPCGVTNDVDIAFVVDATGSMGDEIEFLKLELEDVIRNTMDKYKSLSLRAGSVFYRDKGDQYLTKNVPFNDDLLKTLNFIKLQSAGGGGDTPEAVDEAMTTALDSLQWNPKARTRILFLILDAPPHNEAKESIRLLTVKAAAMGIRIVPIACSGTDKTTEFLLRSMALATNGTYTFLTNHSGLGNSHIEPTTDKYEVELLGNLLQRIIGQYLAAKDCADEKDVQAQQPVKQPENILSIKLYPNPTSGQFTIESNKDLKEIYITDFTGKILMRLNATDKKGRWQVDISMYPSATYLVKYITTDNKWGAEKVVLMR